METITKQMILGSIGKVYEESKDCKLEGSFLEAIHDELEVLSKYFRTTKNQAFFISMVFALNYKGNPIDLNVLIDYFACNPMKMLEYSEDLDCLFSKRIFENKSSKYRLKLERANDEFIINQKINEAILQVKDIPEIDQIKIDDIEGLLEGLYDLSQQRNDDKISTFELFEQIDELISENEHFPLIEKIKEFKFDIEDTYVFLDLIWKTISGKESIDISEALGLS